MRRRTINLKCHRVAVYLTNNFQIVLTFYGSRSSKIPSDHKINITLDWYYLRHLNSLFRKITKQAQARIDDSGFNDTGD